MNTLQEKTDNSKPILFSTQMVQAILRGDKKQTRRAIKPQPKAREYSGIVGGYDNIPFMARFYTKREPNNPLIEDVTLKYKVGDILWVRETWQHTRILNLHPTDENYGYVYKADGQPWDSYENWKWKPSIFMPKEACRIFLKLTKIRIERLQDITDSDIVKEGAADFGCCTKQLNWQILWEKINGVESWKENPWVFVYEFERV